MNTCWMGVAVVVWAAAARADDLGYRLRDQNRYEGVKSAPVASPEFEALSFVRGDGLSDRLAGESLSLRFYVTAAQTVNIVARDLGGALHYRMIPQQTAWGKGWNRFDTWPRGAVIAPLGLRLEEIGILADTDSRVEGSRELVPVVIGAAGKGSMDRYQFHFRARSALEVCRYEVRDRQTGRVLANGEARDIRAGIPRRLDFRVRLEQERLLLFSIRCLYPERPGGPQPTYAFIHEPAAK